MSNTLTAHIDREIKDSFSVTRLDDKTFATLLLCRLNYHRIFLVKAGSGNLQIDGEIYPVKGNELFLLAKGQVYAFQTNTRVTGYELCFGDCFWEKAPASASNCKAVLFNNAAANQHIPTPATDLHGLETLFNLLHEEYIKDTYINQLDTLAAYLKIIMIKIANVNALLTKGYDSYENQLYRRFVELVSNQYKTTHEVAWFSGQLGVSARNLTEICKRCSGKGAKDIINGQLIAEAKRSLQFSSIPVKEIAYQLNFSAPDQFSHFFKKNTQLSPNDYRDHFVKIGM
jgi:AraC family transcriptional activator of pobA